MPQFKDTKTAEWLKKDGNNFKVMTYLSAFGIWQTYGDLDRRLMFLLFSGMLVYGFIRGWYTKK